MTTVSIRRSDGDSVTDDGYDAARTQNLFRLNQNIRPAQ